MDDVIPETVNEALALWDSDRSVFSVEMGGIGPGYEQCIQVLAFELMRAWKDLAWPAIGVDLPDAFTESLNSAAEPVISRLDREAKGFSGAQVGAAKSLAACVCRRGYRTALRDDAVKDRLIQVSRKLPVFS